MDMENPGRQPARPRLDGTKLRLYRDAAYLTQAELAAKAGNVKQTVCRHESGRGPAAKPSQIRKYAKALGIKPEDLLLRDAA